MIAAATFTAERAGDRAVVVRFNLRPSRRLSSVLIALALDARGIEGVLDAIPGHRTVLIETASGAASEVAERVRALQPRPTSGTGKSHTIRVSYDGPDLEWAARTLSLPAAEIVRLHSAATYDVRLIGSPGFVYLSQAPARIHMPRRDEPRHEVPAGSVGIGGRQAGIYARAMPGGWRLLGTAVALPDLAPGDSIRFTPA